MQTAMSVCLTPNSPHSSIQFWHPILQ